MPVRLAKSIGFAQFTPVKFSSELSINKSRDAVHVGFAGRVRTRDPGPLSLRLCSLQNHRPCRSSTTRGHAARQKTRAATGTYRQRASPRRATTARALERRAHFGKGPRRDAAEAPRPDRRLSCVQAHAGPERGRHQIEEAGGRSCCVTRHCRQKR